MDTWLLVIFGAQNGHHGGRFWSLVQWFFLYSKCVEVFLEPQHDSCKHHLDLNFWQVVCAPNHIKTMVWRTHNLPTIQVKMMLERIVLWLKENLRPFGVEKKRRDQWSKSTSVVSILGIKNHQQQGVHQVRIVLPLGKYKGFCKSQWQKSSRGRAETPDQSSPDWYYSYLEEKRGQ